MLANVRRNAGSVSKEALLCRHTGSCGWDLAVNSKNTYIVISCILTFSGFIGRIELDAVIQNSAYSEEVKSNYTGSPGHKSPISYKWS